ncbi:putative quinol monooxygenase [Arenibacter sp. S6351L]|uniref:putative quinol monooxygenase n=1 Tax=Arenibacter sp. S6351L TaxID=2926407 RepID=UPI001FF2773B|nr:putative quinol monooxygenase [Arenibacter sp. S6351L]MCK0133005.1 antibiotic biosynthesis monooxygenase [Arenibacter sp. S6351L]
MKRLSLYKICSIVLCSMMTVIVSSQENAFDKQTYTLENMMVRIAKIEVEEDYLEEYIALLKEEAEASVRLEPGVICIYPMFQKEKPTQIRLLEIYADKGAYESHLQSPHFKHYKETTLPMIKSLQLVEMEAIDKETMASIFKKMKTQ